MNALVLWFPEEGQSSPAPPLCCYTHGTCILCWIQEVAAWPQTLISICLMCFICNGPEDRYGPTPLGWQESSTLAGDITQE